MSKKPMNVLLVAEGGHERFGALENLVKRLGGSEANLTAARVSDRRVHAFHGVGDGHTKRALGWLEWAQQARYDALILLIDHDRPQEKRTEQICKAQEFWDPDEPASNLPRAMGVAIKMFDAWMLADEKALAEVLGCPVAKQRDPETIRHPKRVCERLLANGTNRMAQREMYAEVALRLDVEFLSSRCPKGSDHSQNTSEDCLDRRNTHELRFEAI
jgi:hypothetical protein